MTVSPTAKVRNWTNGPGFLTWSRGQNSHGNGIAGPTSRRRDCHFADVPSISLLKQLLKEEGGCSRVTVSPTARPDAALLHARAVETAEADRRPLPRVRHRRAPAGVRRLCALGAGRGAERHQGARPARDARGSGQGLRHGVARRPRFAVHQGAATAGTFSTFCCTPVSL